MNKTKTTVMAAILTAASLAVVILTGCGGVHSSELATTDAGDLRLSGWINQFNDDAEAIVSMKMETLQSAIGIEFTMGETLKTTSDAEEGFSEAVYLSNVAQLNIDNSYDGFATKPIAGGNYYVTYTDKDDVATTATIPAGDVSDIIAPAVGAELSGDTVNIQWDPELMDGEIFITVTYKNGDMSGFKTKGATNTGSYDFDISGMQGTGTIKLYDRLTYKNLPGFAESTVYMNNIARVDVTFDTAVSDTMLKSVGIDAEAGEEIDIVGEKLDSCSRVCEEGEEEKFTVDNMEYSCCIE